MRLTIVLLVALTAATALGQETPSIKEDIKDAGRSVESGVKGGYEKAKDATVKGVGTALKKTGQGIGKAGEEIEGAGEATEKKVE